MKKLTKLMAILMALCLITSSFVGSTLAKYVTNGTGADSARVAKFGVTITPAEEMFGDAYTNTPDHIATTWTSNEQSNEITVQASSEGTNVVAPGTKGTLAGFAVTGTPEVDVQVSYVADLKLTDWILEDDTTEYCPIVFKVNDVEIKMDNTITTVAALETAVEEAIVAKAARYHTNTDLSTVVYDDVKVEWEWPFYVSDENDDKDTQLGDLAAAALADSDDDTKPAEISLSITTTVTQID